MKKPANSRTRKRHQADLKTTSQNQLPEGLLNPPIEARARWHAIPLLFGDSVKAPMTTGQIGFDSWAGATIGLRDLESGHIRRLRFTAGTVTLELVAEFGGNSWEFVARVYSGDVVSHNFVLEAGRKRILATSDGFYLWNSGTLLRHLRLIALDCQIDFGGLTW